MRLIGGLCLLICCTFAGFSAAGSLRAEEQRICTVRQMLSAVCNSLSSTLPLISDLLRNLAGQAAFSGLPFLQDAAAHADRFPECWGNALEHDKTLSPRLKAILREIGGILGAMPLEEQLRALSLCDAELQALLEEARTNCRQRSALWQRLGVMSGLFLAILVL